MNPSAPDIERECALLRRKVDAGAAFALSQPVFEPSRWSGFAGRTRSDTARSELPLLAGVLPLVSAPPRRFLHNEVPGVVDPGGVRERLRAAGDRGGRIGPEARPSWSRRLRETAAAGVYLMPQFGRFDVAAELVETLRRA